ncbi:MAG: DNA-directed RNA polymerase subunit beta [Rickettsiales bacterium]|nr:DNA-directed RNA polymerase subunit beta [Rickettsiales bacterium]
MKALNHSNYVLRRSFSDREDDEFIPDLIFLQKESFDSFICIDNKDEEKRKKSKIQEVLESYFPMTDSNKNIVLEFLGYRVGEIRYSVKECINSGRTYSIPLYSTLRLLVLDSGEEGEEEKDVSKKEIKAIKEQEVFLCDVPLMTPTGSFVINGIERVVVSQMKRAPGVFFDSEDAKMFAGKSYMAKIIPIMGSWLDFEFDGRDILYFRIDKKRKMPVSYLFKMLRMSIEEVLMYFYRGYTLEFDGKDWTIDFDFKNSLGKIFSHDITDANTREVVIPRGKKVTKRVIDKLKGSNFSRYVVSEDDNSFFVLLNDVVDDESGEILLQAGSEVDLEKLGVLKKLKIKGVRVVIPDNSDLGHYVYNSLLLEKEKTRESVFFDIYRTVRVSEDAPNLEAAEKFVDGIFFSSRYNLSDVGRMKINYRLGLNTDSNLLHLTKEDILATIKVLSSLKHNDEKTDDIDNLTNRRLRCTGELMEAQFRAGMAKVERSIIEKMNSLEPETIVPQNLINTKPLATTMADFFATSQLSQFMDQTNPLAALGHKRRITALGPGGLTRERAGFDVRDIHFTHYGKICPIDSPEGANIGLINSLSIFARINKYGFIETPYRKVDNGILTDEIVYLSAIEEAGKVFCPYKVKLDENNRILGEILVCRRDSEIITIAPNAIDYIDISPRQTISVTTGLIPFLENNESRRVSMGANMLKQAVPLLKTEAPFVGTGMERMVATFFNCGVVISEVEGIVKYVDANKIVIEELQGDNLSKIHTYILDKYLRTNNDTVVNQYPIVGVGQRVRQNEIIADSQNIERGELALGKNVLVAFSTWDGYNYEDSILISEKLVREDAFTSIHLEEFEIEAKDTRLGAEEITRDIPNVGDDVLRKLDETGMIYIGAHIKAGDILVGKTTPKSESPQTPEEKLLKVIFGEKAMDVKDSSLYVPPSVTSGIVIDVKVYTRNGLDKDERAKFIDNNKIENLARDRDREITLLRKVLLERIKPLILNEILDKSIDKFKKGTAITDDLLEELPNHLLGKISVENQDTMAKIDELIKQFRSSVEKIEKRFTDDATKIKECDELPQGTLKKVKVIIATKERMQAGDKMAGRYGNKGVISKILPVEDMPYMEDGTPIDIVLSPLSIPSRMNVGQLLETHLGFVSAQLGKQISNILDTVNKNKAEKVKEKLLRIYKMPKEINYINSMSEEDLLEFAESLRRNVPFETGSFENITIENIEELMEEAGIDRSGQVRLIDGRTGEYFDRLLTIGYMYMLKLHHLVDNKIHARATGPYSLITQQPLGGKSHFGGQRFGEMECWALQAYGAAYTLQEMLTVKSDDMVGRLKMFESIVQGSQSFSCGVPESFNVMVKEVRSLGLNLELIKK